MSMTGRNDSGRRVSFEVGGGTMAGVAFGYAGHPPEILFLHANGLNALTYRTLLEPLGEHYHVVAVDLRGHGRTTLPTPVFGYNSWNRHRDDVIDLITRHFPAAVTIAGHSMGGTVALLTAGVRADLVRGTCLIEPVLLPALVTAPFYVPGAALLFTATTPLSRGALGRRNHFDNKEAAFEAYKGRGFFKSWSDDALHDYIEDALVACEKGGFKLACAPFYEARTYSAHAYNVWGALARAPDPIVIMRAEHGSTITPGAARRAVDLRPDVRMAVIEGATHALPMEKPDRVRAAIESAALMAGGKDRFLGLD
jgi:pimeloyl-ACP methyl ester carboxylesterase